MARGQISLTVGDALEDSFRDWCDNNGYHAKKVFLAGWLSLAEKEHPDRMALFERLGELQGILNGQLGKPPGAESKGRKARPPREAQQ